MDDLIITMNYDCDFFKACRTYLVMLVVRETNENCKATNCLDLNIHISNCTDLSIYNKRNNFSFGVNQ